MALSDWQPQLPKMDATLLGHGLCPGYACNVEEWKGRVMNAPRTKDGNMISILWAAAAAVWAAGGERRYFLRPGRLQKGPRRKSQFVTQRLRFEGLERRDLLAADMDLGLNVLYASSPVDMDADVNNDGVVAPLDALLVISKLNADGWGDHAVEENPRGVYFDVTDDGLTTPADALGVINAVNAGVQSMGSHEPVDYFGSDFWPDVNLDGLVSERDLDAIVQGFRDYGVGEHDPFQHPNLWLDPNFDGVCSHFDAVLVAEYLADYGRTEWPVVTIVKQGELLVTPGEMPPSRLLLGGTRDSVLSVEFTAVGEDAAVSQIVVGVTGDASNSVLCIELFKKDEQANFAFAFFSGTQTMADGQEARLFTANLPVDALVVDDMKSTVIVVSPYILTDVMKGVSGATPTFFLHSVRATGMISTNDIPVSFEPIVGNQNVVVMAKVDAVTSKLPARSYPQGPDQEFARIEFMGAVSTNMASMNLEGLVFTIDVVNGQLGNVELYRTSHPATKVAGTLYDSNGVELIGSFTGSGTVYALFEGLTASAVDTIIGSGQAVSFSLKGDFGRSKDFALPSSIQVSLTDLNNSNAEFGVNGSHIRWNDNGVFGTEVDWLEIKNDVVGPFLTT